MQLTGTNRSIGLIALIFSVHSFVVIAGLDPAIHRNKDQCLAFKRGPRVKPGDCARMNASHSSLFRILVLRRPGGSSEELEPDPIPNSAVKLLSANGTMA